MALSYSEKEAGIQEAIGAWQSNPGRPIADIAREFEVSPWALRRRLHGVPSKIDGGGHNKKLTPDGEQAVIQHIQLLEDFGIALRPKFLRDIANSILRINHIDFSTPPPTVGINWPANFIKRHSELHKQKQKPLAIERKRSHDPAAILDWFHRLRSIRSTWGILDDDIYNMDETGYRTGCGRAHWIITTRPRERQYLQDPDNRVHISSIECVSATGFIVPPTIILPGTQITHNFIVP
jgi:Tc5 transposase DNA-binding domain